MFKVLLISLLLASCNNLDKTQIKSYQSQSILIKNELKLNGIQDKIYDAFVQDLMSRDSDSANNLNKLSTELNELYIKRKNNIILYWSSYLDFYLSIYYLRNNDKVKAKDIINRGIKIMHKMKKKNSEDYSLIAMLQGFSIQFENMKGVISISKDIKSNLKKALYLDENNLRAYFVYASNDFRIPKKYGGGKKTEEYLLKAISLPVQKIKNDYLPSWGKEESYEMLIKFYIKNKNWDSAKKYFNKAITLYPESYTINKLASKILSE